MLSIGEFSKICKVSTKTLRYYDEIGLIHPEDINPENGYRRVFPQSPRISYTQPSPRRTTLRRLPLISIFHKT
ncbi:Transcriptional regulator, MerR family [Bacillus subtilis]|nr:Transcriptional regulator, MerR family [Bacillus subtilis]